MAQKRVRKCTILKQVSNDNWKWYRKTDNGNELSDIEILASRTIGWWDFINIGDIDQIKT